MWWSQMMYQYPNFMWWLPWLSPFIFIDLALKAVALWKAGRNNQLYWFIALLVINSVGILPLVYLYFFQKKIK